MQTLGLSWQHSFEVAGVLATGGAAAALSRSRRVKAVGAFAREAAVIGALYALWQLAGEISITSTGNATDRARSIQRLEHYLPLPSEHTLQHAVLGNHLLIQFANIYYAAMHMTVMLAFLLWLFLRHRERYRPVRQVMAWTTLGCLFVQLWPVAPPRMFPGIVDTGLLYNQSVYSNGLPIDQLSAMPSVHVAWAVLVGYYGYRVARGRWRYLAPAHATFMVFCVVVTGNHWWLDGIVATAILAVCAWGVFGVRTAWHAAVARWQSRRLSVADEFGSIVDEVAGVDAQSA